MKKSKLAFSSNLRRDRLRRKVLSFEPIEPRLLLSGVGYIAGYATNADASVDPNATIQLYNSTGTTLLRSTTTNSDGYYRFDNVAPGTYDVAEVKGGYASTASAPQTTINPASVINGGTAFQVQVLDPTTLNNVTLSRFADPYASSRAYFQVANGVPYFNSVTSTSGDTVHQYNLGISNGVTGSPATQSNLLSLCTDLLHAVPLYQANAPAPTYTTSASLTPQSPAIAANIGRIGYLYDHFGMTSQGSVNGAALQLAVWELEYDTSPDLLAGNFQVFTAVGQTDPAVILAANNYLAMSQGKSESAYFLLEHDPAGSMNGQGMICTDLLNFVSTPAKCDPSLITCISYTDLGSCGTSTFSSLGGKTHQGDQVTANFFVKGTSPVIVTLVSYVATSNFDLTRQTIFSVDTRVLQPGCNSLTVTIPNSYYQIDLVCGEAIAQFNPSANVTYHGQQRFIDSDNGGSEVAPTAFAGLSGNVFADTNADGLRGPGESGINGVVLQLTGIDIKGQKVTETRVTDADGSYTFPGLQPGTYAVTEVVPSGRSITRTTVGTDRGLTDGTVSSPTSKVITGIVLGAGDQAIQYNFGNGAAAGPVGAGQTASCGFWASSTGQNLILAMNGGPTSTRLGHWLATECPNLFGSLDGKTNKDVASTFKGLVGCGTRTAESEVMSLALSVYVTDLDLAGGSWASQCGLVVSSTGTGACTLDLGNSLAGWGGPRGVCSLDQLLKFCDSKSSNGSCAKGNAYLYGTISYGCKVINDSGGKSSGGDDNNKDGGGDN